jgi:hypothetical protein
MKKQKQEPSTSKNINKKKNLSTFENKNKTLVSKKKNENLQPPRTIIRTFNL